MRNAKQIICICKTGTKMRNAYLLLAMKVFAWSCKTGKRIIFQGRRRRGEEADEIQTQRFGK